MRPTPRSGFTLIELLVATSIVGLLAGIAGPIALSVRQSAVAQRALTELRAVDVALSASCGRGNCGPFSDSSSTSSVLANVPTSLKEFLPAGFRFSHDSTTYALQMETWTVAPVATVTPVCVSHCSSGNNGNGNNGNGNNGNGNGNNGNGNGNGGSKSAPPAEDPGFTNTAGTAAPSAVYVTLSIVTKNGAVARALYGKAGGTPPVFITNGQVWKYSYPALVAVPATG